MIDKAYVVGGNCGSYEDKQEWIVKIFLDKKKADRFCKKLMQVTYDIGGLDTDKLIEALKEAGDINLWSAQSDVEYSVWEVPFE